MTSLDLTVLAVLFAVVVAAQTVETVAGFGATVISLSIGVHFVQLEWLVVTLVLIGLLQSTWIVVRGRKHIRTRLLFTRVLPFCAVGMIAGNTAFQHLPTDMLKTILGLFVVFFSSFRLWQLFRGEATKPLTRMAGAGFLIGGGFFHGLFASGGPLVVYFVSRAIDSRHAFRATLSSLWLVLNVALLASYAWHGQLGQPSLTLAAMLLPAVGVGILVGEFVHHRVDEVLFRKVVQGLLLFTGLCLLL
jgi:uncharacterized membrane protein YfcA